MEKNIYDVIPKYLGQMGFNPILPWPSPYIDDKSTLQDVKFKCLQPRIDFLISLQTKLNLNGPTAKLKKFFDFINIFK